MKCGVSFDVRTEILNTFIIVETVSAWNWASKGPFSHPPDNA
jgi:hypothetical protein